MKHRQSSSVQSCNSNDSYSVKVPREWAAELQQRRETVSEWSLKKNEDRPQPAQSSTHCIYECGRVCANANSSARAREDE